MTAAFETNYAIYMSQLLSRGCWLEGSVRCNLVYDVRLLELGLVGLGSHICFSINVRFCRAGRIVRIISVVMMYLEALSFVLICT